MRTQQSLLDNALLLWIAINATVVAVLIVWFVAWTLREKWIVRHARTSRIKTQLGASGDKRN